MQQLLAFLLLRRRITTRTEVVTVELKELGRGNGHG